MAASLFRPFSFDASASHHHDAERAAMNVSPTSMLHTPGRLPTPPPCSVGELASRFGQQHLHVEVDPTYQWPLAHGPHTPPADDLAFSVQQLSLPSPRPYSRISSAVLRMQRQSNTRLQSSSSHVKDISKLVERMVQDGEQCHIHDSKSPPLSPTSSNSSNSDDDEAIDMEYHPESHPIYALHFRRSSDRLSGCAAVSRDVRMRKRLRVTKRSLR